MSLESAERSSHVHYSSKVFLSGDSHENILQQPVAGTLNVALGDLINPKKTPAEGTSMYSDWKEGFKRKINRWTESVTAGETVFLLGNHEAQFLSALVNGPAAANIFLYSQKTGKEKGMATLKALDITVPKHITEENYSSFVTTLLTNETLHGYADMLIARGSLYAVINDVYISHTLPITDARGHLLPLTADGKRGMDALDTFEHSLRGLSANPNDSAFRDAQLAIAHLATKEFDLPFEPGKQVLGPLWVREQQREELLKNKRSIGRLLTELDTQAQVRHARVFATVHGHVHKGGEIIYARSDTGRLLGGVVVNIDFSRQSQHRSRAHLVEKDGRVVLFCPSDGHGNAGGLVRLGLARSSRRESFSSSNNVGE